VSFTLPENSHNQEAIELAKRLGTYGKHDRSEQYQGRYSNEVLLRNDNLQFAKLRELEDRQFWHGVAIAVVTAALARLPEFVVFVMQFFQ
jgi:hypothetical protein